MDKLQEIRETLQAATPAPWKVSRPDSLLRSQRITGKDEDGDNVPVCEVFLSVSATKGEYVEPDAHLIASAPEWLSYLLSELEASKENRLHFEKEAFYSKEQCKILQQQLDTVKQEIEQKDKQLKNFKEAWDEQTEEIRSLRAGYTSANAKRDEELYFWEPFAENHLETLTGGVVIRAEWIRQLIQEAVDTVKQENERLKEQLENNVNIQSGYMNHLQQRLKQAIEALEDIEDYQHRWSDSPIREVQKIAHKALSLIRGEVGNPSLKGLEE